MPAQNQYGVQAKRSYTSPVDNVDLGTAFGVRERLPQTRTMSHILTDEIFRSLIDGADAFARHAGLLDSDASPGTRFHAGELIGRTIDLSGHGVESHRAPRAGRLLNVVTWTVVSPGDMLYLIVNSVEGEGHSSGQSSGGHP